MVDFLTVTDKQKRSAGWTIGVFVVVILASFYFCGKASAAEPITEVRGGYREGAIAGILVEGKVEKARIGGLLEFSEDDAVALLGRVTWAKQAGRVGFYAGLGAGIAFEDEPLSLSIVDKDGDERHGRRSLVVSGGDKEAGFACEALGGVRGMIRPGLMWNIEVMARDSQAKGGFGTTIGLRFKP